MAGPATPPEADEVLALAATSSVGYRTSRHRIGDRRRVRALVLDPLSAA